MKKRLLLIPLVGLLLSGCDLTNIFNRGDKNSQEIPDIINPDEEKEDEKEDEKPTDIKVTSVTLNKSHLTLEEMQSETLTCTVLPTDATNKEVTWSISDPLVASVTDGVVYANNPGTATITVASVDGNKTATCTLTVTAKVPEVKTISSTLDFTEKYYSKSDKEITEFTYEQEIDFQGTCDLCCYCVLLLRSQI